MANGTNQADGENRPQDQNLQPKTDKNKEFEHLPSEAMDLRYQREKYIQDRQALEKYQAVMSLLDMLERELGQRLKKMNG
ncbi:MAG: hypothetical protein ACOX15_07085 [Tepidanaerobacteraceae bacterium]|jgi:hypothetical protein